MVVNVSRPCRKCRRDRAKVYGNLAYRTGEFFDFLLGTALPLDHIISTYSVFSTVECAMKCLQTSTCVGYNHKNQSKGDAVNCQLSNKTEVKRHGGNGVWTFYHDLRYVSKRASLFFLSYGIIDFVFVFFSLPTVQ